MFPEALAPSVLWTGAILADWAQKDCRERPLNKRDFLLDDLIGSGLYDSEASNSFLEQSQRYTATCILALYDHVIDMKYEVARSFPRLDCSLMITFLGCYVVPAYERPSCMAVGAES